MIKVPQVKHNERMKKSTLEKIEETVVRYGEVFGAEKLVDITAPAHMVMSAGVGVLVPFYDMLDEIISEGLIIDKPFTVDPRPYDKNLSAFFFHERIVNRILFRKQKALEAKLSDLGLKSEDSFTCACYLPEVGNIPGKGDILAWAESSAVVYANSVLGARTNRNSGGIDILCNVLGKVPFFGFLTDEGRLADYEINLETTGLPDPQILGSFIGLKVQDKVPYIKGLKRYLDNMPYLEMLDYLKDMGAASAASGAVGLYHVNGITPEAKEKGKNLLRNNYEKVSISHKDLHQMVESFPQNFDKKIKTPDICFIGCPHLSYNQVLEWSDCITQTLEETGKGKAAMRVFISTAPAVVTKINEEHAGLCYNLAQQDIYISTFCPLAISNNPFISMKRTATNSGKLRNYTNAVFYEREELLSVIAGIKK